MQFFAIFLLFISMSAIAQDTSRVSNIKCKGGWISTGTSKLEVISYCGQPKYTDVTSGANTVKTEDLLYTIKHKDYIISFRNGKVVRLGAVK
ncbi:DUF2845 domain-containing protein [Paraglaciecola aquimarina]|uniref:DUF2845 domain-containing protein n=1 Tax=Paraglaciecola algarum TaxID=3050085 RepID=A0ABS9D859_9ALTE|nr:DUF2845 domain-containing protein [Paraglaciecola sp. G1-23]MCF2948555.1 DUF2845 domain-containing protein [Paraglaciecola sp. G1-23]